MIALTQFLGEIPKIKARLLSPAHASSATNCKMEQGALNAYHRPTLVETLADDALTVYKHNGSWLSWNSIVDVVPGPVAQDRLYITGDGVPKVRMENGTTYNLKVPAPAAKAAVTRRKMDEWVTVDSKEVRLLQGRTAKSSTLGVSINVAVRYTTATVTVTHPTGLTEAQAQTLVNSIKYRCNNGGATLVTSQKIVRLIRIRDNGGQTLDPNRNPLGSDTRLLEDIGASVYVNGASSVVIPAFTFPTPPVQDATDYASQNDPPTLSTTGAAITFNNGDAAATLFSSTSISTIESGQEIILLEFTIEGLTNGSIDPQQTSVVRYVYTYVTSFDEESGPSPLTDTVGWSPGQTIRVQTFSAAPGGRAIDRIRVYRSQTSASGVTDLYFVGEIAHNASFFEDVIDYIPAGEPLPSLDYTMPLDTLSGITSMPNGMMAAFSGRELFFCEPWRPHAWPAKYALIMDAEIVGLASFGSTLAVMTKKQPYIVQCTHPDNATSEKIEVNLPCLSKRSIVDMGYFAAYASTEGLVTIANTGAQLVSQNLFTDRQWRDMNIASFVCSKHQGRYVISHDDLGSPVQRRCTLIDLTGQDPYIVRTVWQPNSFFFDEGVGTLYFLRSTYQIYEFDPVAGPHEVFRWKSKEFVLPYLSNFGYIRVDAYKPPDGGVFSVRVFGDDTLVAEVHGRNRIETLPGGGLYRSWHVEVISTNEVEAVYLANSPAEIARMAG